MFPDSVKISGHVYIPRPEVNLYYVKVRPRGAKQFPATEAGRQIQSGGNLGNQWQFILPWKWVEFLKSQQGSDHEWNHISTPNAGIFNRTENPDGSNDLDWYENHREPAHNVCLFDGNVVNVIGEFGNFYEIQTINVVTDPVPSNVTFYTHPWLVHQVTSVTVGGTLRGAGPGLVNVFTVLYSKGKTGIEKEKLERWTSAHPKLPGR